MGLDFGRLDVLLLEGKRERLEDFIVLCCRVSVV